MKSKLNKRKKIHLRIRKNVSGTADRPRLSVFRSNKAIYCQLIDDVNGHTLASASSALISASGTKIDVAREVGKAVAAKAKDLQIAKAVFDRSGYLYHGRVKALADGAREGGLNF